MRALQEVPIVALQPLTQKYCRIAPTQVLFIKLFRTKHSSNTVLCLVRNLMNKSLVLNLAQNLQHLNT